MLRLAGVLGLVALVGCQSAPGTAPITSASTVVPATTAAPETTELASTTVATTTTSVAVTTTAVTDVEIYLVWASGGLEETFADTLDERASTTVVRGDMAELRHPDGSVVPLDALAIDRTTYAEFFAAAWLDTLGPGTVVLSETSAELREAVVGDELDIAGSDFTVAAIVPDAEAGYAEVVFDAADPAQPARTTRYALMSYRGERGPFESELIADYDGPTPITVKTDDDTDWMRHGDAVLPQMYIKTALGEFSYTNRRGAEFVQSAEFTEANIATVDLPILGEVKCHEVVIEMLRGALAEIEREGLAATIDPSGFAGCWYPRLIRTVSGTPAGVSRHSWGAAVDINAPTNRLGEESTQDPRLVEIMRRWGFNWGGDWLVPDPMHFEYGIPPQD